MKCFVLLLIYIFIHFDFAAPKKFHEHLTEEELFYYFGVKDFQDVSPYDLIIPEHVKGNRFRRTANGHEEPLQYKVKAFGEEYHLELFPNEDLLPTGCVVKTLTANGTHSVLPCTTNQESCYYIGQSLLHKESRVAMSICNGLHGIVRVSGLELVIQPLKAAHTDHATDQHSDNLHLVYMRSNTQTTCHMTDVGELTDGLNLASHRVRRETDKKYLELLVVADPGMFRVHGNDTQRYTLMAVNIAALRFLDGSLGNQIVLSVVALTILQENQKDLEITSDADFTLNAFCEWQERFNPDDDSHPQHADAAVLITRQNIVSRGRESTSGLAYYGGICRRMQRCAVVQDSGLDLGLTVAHELAHSLGIHHDGDGNHCAPDTYIMAASSSGGPTAFQWSTCSATELHTLLRRSGASCLDDAPVRSLKLTNQKPGSVYDVNDQCRLVWGDNSRVCEGTSLSQRYGDECAILVCFSPTDPTTCVTSHSPRMDGTECGLKKWCIRGQCVDYGTNGPDAVDGGWATWDSDWSSCSQTCGGGVQYKRRRCNNPRPMYGGQQCEGEDTMARLCNIEVCSVSEEEFKAEQCAATDNQTLLGVRYHWVPHTGQQGDRQCQFWCRTVNGNMLHRRGKRFTDGTACHIDGQPGSFFRCLNGRCMVFGCDGEMGSSRHYDACMVCDGDGSSCHKVTGSFNKGAKHRYVSFVTVPQGSTSVTAVNKNAFSHMSVEVRGERLFNKDGDGQDLSSSYSRQNVTVRYQRKPEKITVDGPLTTDIKLQAWQIYSLDDYLNVSPEIFYEYYEPVLTQRNVTFVWKVMAGQCSQTCGTGSRTAIVSCAHSLDGRSAEDRFCDIRTKPSAMTEPCNTSPCPPHWQVGSYGACSRSCGTGVETRTVQCVHDNRNVQHVVGNRQCAHLPKPPVASQCNTQTCPGVWVTSPWSACSKTCSYGIRTRNVACHKDHKTNQEVKDSQCVAAIKPAGKEFCMAAVCITNISCGQCKDTVDCSAYGKTDCMQYPDWAKSHCPAFCGFCSHDCEKPSVSPSPYSACNDLSDCASYGKDVCQKYVSWSETNCPRFCGVCEGQCQDVQHCSQYGSDVCTEYADWSKVNCQKYCGLCRDHHSVIQTSAGQTNCEDQSTDCQSYAKSVCDQYKDWARQNCRKFCDLCEGTVSTFPPPKSTVSTVQTPVSTVQTPVSTVQTPVSTVQTPVSTVQTPVSTVQTPVSTVQTPVSTVQTPVSTVQTPVSTVQTPVSTVQTPVCRDTVECSAYGSDICSKPEHLTWNKQHCPHFCGLCSGSRTITTSTAVACEDKHSHCEQYGKSVCSHFKQWAAENCAKFCDLCSHRSKRSTHPQRRLCNSVLTAETGSVDLIERLVEGTQCTQVIVAPLGKLITLKVLNVNLQCGKGDKLTISEVGGKRMVKICSIGHPFQYMSSSNTLVVSLHVARRGHGVYFNYTMLPSDQLVPACSQQLTAVSGVVTSPGYPHGYGPTQRCEAYITGPPGTRVQVRFDDLSLEAGDADCRHDLVALYDLEAGGSSVYCGERESLIWESSSPFVKIVFITDRNNSGRGFAASYSIMEQM